MRIKIIKTIIRILFSAFILHTSAEAKVTSSKEIAAAALSRNPELCDGKVVIVRGYFVKGPESQNLYQSTNISSPKKIKLCLGIDIPNSLRDRSRYLTGKIVIVTGIFRKKDLRG